jgi:hypothetical protein
VYEISASIALAEAMVHMVLVGPQSEVHVTVTFAPKMALSTLPPCENKRSPVSLLRYNRQGWLQLQGSLLALLSMLDPFYMVASVDPAVLTRDW